MIKVFRNNEQDYRFYAIMGRYFADLDIAKELERQVYNKPKTTWYIAMRRNNFEGYLSRGFVSVHETPKYYFIDNFFVLPPYRGMGIGDELINRICEDFTGNTLKCIACNPVAIHIFKKCGFVEDGHNGKYKKFVKH